MYCLEILSQLVKCTIRPFDALESMFKAIQTWSLLILTIAKLFNWWVRDHLVVNEINKENRPWTWTPETEPVLMRASQVARLGQEKPHEAQATHTRTDHPQAANCWTVAESRPKRRRCLSHPRGVGRPITIGSSCTAGYRRNRAEPINH